jgi:hypothetical protein
VVLAEPEYPSRMRSTVNLGEENELCFSRSSSKQWWIGTGGGQDAPMSPSISRGVGRRARSRG